MRTIDNILEYFCRTKNGWSSTNCETPRKIKPLAIDTLYKTNTKKIHTSLFDSKSIELLNDQQWNLMNDKENSQTMLQMFEEIRTMQTTDGNVCAWLLNK